MEDQDLYSFNEDKDAGLQTAELDDFLSTDDKSNDNKESEELLISDDQDVDILKEEPVLSSLEDSPETGLSEDISIESSSDDLEFPDQKESETVSDDIDTPLPEAEKQDDEILFTDSSEEKAEDEILETNIEDITVDEIKDTEEEVALPESPSVEPVEEGGEVLFSDEQIRDDLSDNGIEQIIVDDETEQIVQDQISMDTEVKETIPGTEEDSVAAVSESPAVEESAEVESGLDEGEVLFTDEEAGGDLTENGIEQIVVDEETEQIIKDQISMKSEKNADMLETSQETTAEEDDISIIDETKVDDLGLSSDETSVDETAEDEASAGEMTIDSQEEMIVEETDVTEEEPKAESVEMPMEDDKEKRQAEAEAASEDDGSSFFNEDEDETISLSSDELNNILEDTSDTGDKDNEEVPTVDSVLAKKQEESTEEVLVEETDMKEPVDSSIKEEEAEEAGIVELHEEEVEVSDIDKPDGPAVGEEEELVLEEVKDIETLGKEVFPEPEEEDLRSKVEEESAELVGLEEAESVEEDLPEEEIVTPTEEAAEEIDKEQPLEEAPSDPSSTSFFDEGEDESISLSSNELDNILHDAEIVEESQDDTVQDEDSAGPAETGDMEEIEETEETVPAAEVSAPLSEEEEAAVSDELSMLTENGEIDKNNLKTIFKYLDDLLNNLPEDKIKEFAQSEYYDLYTKLLDNLGI